ncbi:DUF4362 domain-containing protein [Chungangia koreensis]|uniref:DUF4362 domain-containing protein n=1 Tax=Chungangia koreensis TaxID=752657 RepID=A0ABV8XB11_9LACT
MIKRFFIFVAFLFLTGCNQSDEPLSGKTPYEHEKGEYEVSEEDIVLRGKGSVNRERLEEFIQHVKEGTQDEVRVIRYTEEGDPIIDDLTFDGSKITATHDTRWDHFGAPDITEQTCESIQLDENGDWVSFSLSGCH